MGRISTKIEAWAGKTECHRQTGVPSRTIQNWLDRKLIATNEAGQVDVIEVLKRDRDRQREAADRQLEKQSSPQQNLLIAQTEKIRIEAAIKKIELEKLEGQLIDIGQVEADLLDVSHRVKAKFLSLPSLAPKLASIDDPRAIAELLKTYADQTLAELQFELLQVAESRESEELGQSL